MDIRESARKIQQVLIYVLFLNWGVALAKLLYGRFIHSASMMADGFHSFSDGASNVIGIVGILIASRPVDANHPYGHKKYETLASTGIAVLLFLVCFNVLREGIMRLLHPVVPQVNAGSFWVMGVTLAVNVTVMVYEYRKGKALKSDILVSDSMHTLTDVLTSISVIIALVGIRMGYPVLDPAVSILISFFIGYAAITILRESSMILSDAAAIPVDEIKQVVLSIKGVKECHKIRSRGCSYDIYIDLHVLVDPSMDVHKAHHLSYAIENKIKKNFQGVTDVVVHLEPLEEKKRDFLT